MYILYQNDIFDTQLTKNSLELNNCKYLYIFLKYYIIDIYIFENYEFYK